MIKYKRMNFVGNAYLFSEMYYLQEVFDMRYIIKIIIIGAVQGLTEFLPVSSSGHTAVLKAIFGLSEMGIAFDVLLHFGTLIAVCLFYYKDILALATEVVEVIKDIFRGRNLFDRNRPYRVLLIMMTVTTIPTAIVGILLEDLFEFSNIAVVGALLLINSLLLYISDKIEIGTKTARTASVKDALIVGLLQSCAIAPGISRSGTTIFAGKLSGFDTQFAVKYSFLCSLPTILGAILLKLGNLFSQPLSKEQGIGYLLAFATSAVVGYLSLNLLKMLTKGKRMKYFSVYCFLLGVFCIVYGVTVYIVSMR